MLDPICWVIMAHGNCHSEIDDWRENAIGEILGFQVFVQQQRSHSAQWRSVGVSPSQFKGTVGAENPSYLG